MGKAEAQAEYDKLAGLLEVLKDICERNSIPEEVEAALEGVSNSDALRNLEDNLRVKRRNVLSELAGNTKAIG